MVLLLRPFRRRNNNNYRYSFGCLIACVFNRSVLPYPYLDERAVMIKVRALFSASSSFVRVLAPAASRNSSSARCSFPPSVVSAGCGHVGAMYVWLSKAIFESCCLAHNAGAAERAAA